MCSFREFLDKAREFVDTLTGFINFSHSTCFPYRKWFKRDYGLRLAAIKMLRLRRGAHVDHGYQDNARRRIIRLRGINQEISLASLFFRECSFAVTGHPGVPGEEPAGYAVRPVNE